MSRYTTIRNGYSYRGQSDEAYISIYRKGKRSLWDRVGTLQRCTDGRTWLVNIYINGRCTPDARPSLREALELADGLLSDDVEVAQ